MPSFEEVPSWQNNSNENNNSVARMIVNDKSGSLRLRVEPTAKLEPS